jgi:glycosyltransferase involved in cell wall biosynthesis
MYAPVALFTYKRPEHTKATLDALVRNTLASKTEIVVYCDGPKKEKDHLPVEKVRRLVRDISGFRSVHIIEREKNIGLAESIISGVTDIFETHESVVVIEDDLVTSPNFLEYMNAALSHYKNDPKAFSIGAYNFPRKTMPIPTNYPWDTYASIRCCSWGWATWADRWRRVDWEMGYFHAFMLDQVAQKAFDKGGPDMTAMLKLQHEGRIDSWAIRFCYAHYANRMHCIYPVKTLVSNIGLDNTGSHCGVDPRREHKRVDEKWMPQSFCPGGYIDPKLVSNFYKAFSAPERPFISRIVRKMLEFPSILVRKLRRLASRIKCILVPTARDVDILMVNTSQKDGGAARAAYRIFCGIRNRYPAAHYLTLIKGDSDPHTTGRLHTSVKGALVQRLARLDRIPLWFYPRRQHAVTFWPAFWPNPLRIPLNRFRPKLVHLHWVAGGMLRVEELAPLRCPLVWTLHDAWAFTGGCHYTRDCEGFKKQCGHCPVLGSEHESDYSRFLMRRKATCFEKMDIIVVAPSRWMAEMAKQSSLLRDRRIEVIPNGLDTESFKPINHQAAREYLNLPHDIPVLLFGAQWLTDPRKGADLLYVALQLLDIPCTLLVFGEGNLPLENAPHITVRRLGSLADDASLALVYSAADVFVCPSREDNLPNTVAEALACGTPCAAFDINGLPEMIEHRKNGWLARPFDPGDLAEGIRWLTQHPQHDQLRRAAREKAVSEYNMALMEERYATLYADVMKFSGEPK